ncbi:MAG: hypothetical protein ACRDTA_21995 [Pseudonocardiaceae bacterium]
MATWISLAVGLLALGGALGSAWLTQRNANHREDIRWDREREREQARWAHEEAARSDERTRQRLADSYLEVLRIVEREGQWVEASITNWTLAAEEQAVFGPDPDYAGRPGFERVKMLEPAVTDRATIAAHLAAFGSANVCGLYQAWRSTITAIDTEESKHRWNTDQAYPEVPSLDDLKHLQDVLHRNERAARQALANAIAKELRPVRDRARKEWPLTGQLWKRAHDTHLAFRAR